MRQKTGKLIFYKLEGIQVLSFSSAGLCCFDFKSGISDASLLCPNMRDGRKLYF